VGVRQRAEEERHLRKVLGEIDARNDPRRQERTATKPQPMMQTRTRIRRESSRSVSPHGWVGGRQRGAMLFHERCRIAAAVMKESPEGRPFRRAGWTPWADRRRRRARR
jgi:hypothetical protein